MRSAGPPVIYETIYGSRAYGLATETSDTDLRGVFVPPPLAFMGFAAQPDQIEPSAERVLYEIRKFFRLAAACNPTVIEVLFTDPQDHVTVGAEGRLLDLQAPWPAGDRVAARVVPASSRVSSSRF